MKILAIGNCQIDSLQTLLQAKPGIVVETMPFSKVDDNDITGLNLGSYNYVFIHSTNVARFPNLMEYVASNKHANFISSVVFSGHHPDRMYIMKKSTGVAYGSFSKIAFFSFLYGLSIDETIPLYCDDFIEKLGYDQILKAEEKYCAETLSKQGVNGKHLVEKWLKQGPFMHTQNHPKLFALEEYFREELKNIGLDLLIPGNLSTVLADPLTQLGQPPVWNSLVWKNQLGIENYLTNQEKRYWITQGRIQDLRTHLESVFNIFTHMKGDYSVNQKLFQVYKTALAEFRDKSAQIYSSNPYRSQPKQAFWKNVVVRNTLTEVRPDCSAGALIGPDTKIATAGSCFAQHIAKTLASNSLGYLVTENKPDSMSEEEGAKQGYGAFSARYGNIYTSRQLLQLFQRAYGRFTPIKSVWTSKSGGYIDPFRPNIGETFETIEALEASRELHFAAVREMFETLDVFVFTLGLTESWVDTKDGSAFPVAPGVVNTAENCENIRFINFKYPSVLEDMQEFLALLRSVNPNCKVILTVSPVPLIATYTDNDALSATTYSKSVLRAVAGDLNDTHDYVSYFPSYEIITGNYNKGQYFAADLRSVLPEGVAHVMDVFMEKLVHGHKATLETSDTPDAAAEADNSKEEYEKLLDVICDEELIVQ